MARFDVATGVYSILTRTSGPDPQYAAPFAEVAPFHRTSMRVAGESNHTITIPKERALALSVIDHASGRPLQGVRVEVQNSSRSTYSGTLSGSSGVVVLGGDATQISLVKSGYATVVVAPPERDRLTVPMSRAGETGTDVWIRNPDDLDFSNVPIHMFATDGPDRDATLIWRGTIELQPVEGDLYRAHLPIAETVWIRMACDAGIEFVASRMPWSPGRELHFRAIRK
jgi:hypothetical protein